MSEAPVRLPIGIHPGIAEEIYHADPAETPSASSSILETINNRSPKHARWNHPRLNKAWSYSGGTDAQNAGSILHGLISGGPPVWKVLNFDNYRTDAAKRARDDAARKGLIPILGEKFDALPPIAEALKATLKADFPDLWAAIDDPETMHEATAIWREEGDDGLVDPETGEAGVLCRCRFDVLPPAKHRMAFDWKFTGLVAEPDEWSRRLVSEHLYQCALYPRSIEAIRGDKPEFLYVVCETSPPYAIAVHAAAPSALMIGDDDVNIALRKWQLCLRDDVWPGYPPLVHYAEAPGWLLRKREDKGMRAQHAARALSGKIAEIQRISGEIGGPLR